MKILNRRIKVKKKSKCIPKKEPKTRKEKRKECRKAAKLRKHEFFAKKKNVPGKFVKISELIQSSGCPNTSDDNIKRKLTSENKKEQRLKEQMQIKRRQQLREANKQEDKLIKRLEKHLRLNKRKTKSVPKSFTEDGLDCILYFGLMFLYKYVHFPTISLRQVRNFYFIMYVKRLLLYLNIEHCYTRVVSIIVISINTLIIVIIQSLFSNSLFLTNKIGTL